jgi:hypothetical protein
MESTDAERLDPHWDHAPCRRHRETADASLLRRATAAATRQKFLEMVCGFTTKAQSRADGTALARTTDDRRKGRLLLLPGALLVAMRAQLLSPFVFVDLRLSAFL